MEFLIESKSCIDKIKWYIRNNIATNITYSLYAIEKYNNQILCNILPEFESNIIMEYINEIFMINVAIEPHHSHDYIITVTNEELNVNHTYLIDIVKSKICISKLIINYIKQIEEQERAYAPDGHHCFLDYYMKHYNPEEKQLTCKYIHDYSKHYWHLRMTSEIIISKINDEQFSDESIIIVNLINNLHNQVTIIN